MITSNSTYLAEAKNPWSLCCLQALEPQNSAGYVVLTKMPSSPHCHQCLVQALLPQSQPEESHQRLLEPGALHPAAGTAAFTNVLHCWSVRAELCEGGARLLLPLSFLQKRNSGLRAQSFRMGTGGQRPPRHRAGALGVGSRRAQPHQCPRWGLAGARDLGPHCQQGGCCHGAPQGHGAFQRLQRSGQGEWCQQHGKRGRGGGLPRRDRDN